MYPRVCLIFCLLSLACKSIKSSESSLQHTPGFQNAIKFNGFESPCKQDPNEPMVFVNYTRHLIARLVLTNEEYLPKGSSKIIDNICLRLNPSATVNAWVNIDSGYFTVTRGILRAHMKENVYAALIAHEMMHFFVGLDEILTNDSATEMLIRAGFPPTSLLELFRYLEDLLEPKPARGSKRTLPFCMKNADDDIHQTFCWNSEQFQSELKRHQDYYQSVMNQPKKHFRPNPVTWSAFIDFAVRGNHESN